ncbi:phosphotransferase enzyme family protein [Lacticaseibacillus manihotivorans]|uniref:Aminoglycoside phosphotransferase domain-containing protein n=3 Tax=Lacticaseibacillus manihotivorans TaxID=88233 RepID=A0A0R1QV97_9LACO|nr:phosphotransferase [Lacticaseibacillus manihotivorans]KRL45064.1 hypothetical protein FD01_GL000853 [Lacticaseibacillus manihotivorans DSM 13343 = JCM 12514]
MITKVFADLTFDEQLAHLTTVAHRALTRWGYPANSHLKLLNYTENATFLVTTPEKPTMVMRVHRLAYTSRDSIHTELEWLAHLRAHTNLKVETPIPTPSGQLIEAIDTPELSERRFVVCFQFVQGESPVDSSDGNADIGGVIKVISAFPKALTLLVFRLAATVQLHVSRYRPTKMTAEDRQLYRTIGQVCATLHKAATHWQYPADFKRMTWDFAGTIGKHNNFYGADYHAPDWLNTKALATIDEAVALCHEHLQHYDRNASTYGMIHSDLRAANLLQNHDELTILDFDDCGMGYYMYDIASVVALMEHRGDLTEVVRELLTGYETIRPLTDADRKMVWTFIMLRRVGMLQSLLSRMGHVMAGAGESQSLTPEVLAFYATGTAGLAKRYCREHPLNETVMSTKEVTL